MLEGLIESLKWIGLPINASKEGIEIDQTMALVHLLMLVLFVGWGIFFIYTIFRFRRSRNPHADYTGVKSHASSYLEIAVAAFEGVLLIGFSIPFWSARVDRFPDPAQSTVVEVVAQQFAWNIHYPGPDGVFGKRDAALIDTVNVIGLDYEDPTAADDVISINQLNVPVDKPVIAYLSSMDVIHSFFLPEMRVKADTIPGMRIPVHWTPTLTTEEMRRTKVEQGYLTEEEAPLHNYTIACAQLCGIGHYRMRGMMTVQTEEEFQAWYDQQLEYAQMEDEYYSEEEESVEDPAEGDGE
jgi:cytochrome c oxidase subunit 2